MRAVFGCMDLPGFDGVNQTQASNHTAKPTCGTAKYVCAGSPGFSFFAPFFARDANNTHTVPYSPQSEEHAVAGGDAIQMFSRAQVWHTRSQF